MLNQYTLKSTSPALGTSMSISFRGYYNHTAFQQDEVIWQPGESSCTLKLNIHVNFVFKKVAQPEQRSRRLI